MKSKKTKNEKILVIGGAGFIGSNICKKLLDKGYIVGIFDSFLQYFPSLQYSYKDVLDYRLEDLIKQGVKIIRGDARYKDNIEQVIKTFKPDRIIHLAAMPISTLSNIYIEEAVDSTIKSTTNILSVIKDMKFVKRFVYTSSSMVYGDFQYTPADENHPTNPKNIYGGAKLCGEIMTKSFHGRFGINYTIIRPSAVYGPTDINQRVSQIFIENGLKGEQLVLKGGDDTKLDFSYVEDVADGFILATLSQKAENETFNITCGEGRSLLEYANLLKKYIPNLKVKIEPVDIKNPQRGTLDISKARKLLHYNPKYNLEKGIEEYLKYKKNEKK